jgi:hypothetical protein
MARLAIRDLEIPEKKRATLEINVVFFSNSIVKLNRKKTAGKGTQSHPPRIQVQEQHQLDPDQQRQIRCDKREKKKQIEEKSVEQRDLEERGGSHPNAR